jgi:hypothetical protein
MRRWIKYISIFLLLHQVNVFGQAPTTYSILSTAYDRVNHTYYSLSDIDQDWFLMKKQIIFGGAPPGGNISLGPIVNYANAPSYVVSNAGNNTFPGIIPDRSIFSTTSVYTTDMQLYTYRTYFNLPDLTQTTKRYALKFKMSSDDAVYQVLLNNHEKVNYIDGTANYNKPTFLTIPFCDSDFMSGENYIDISVADLGSSISCFYAEIELLEIENGCSGSEIKGKVFNDLNNNQVFDSGTENGLVNWFVNLKDASNSVVMSAITNANGDYSFLNVPIGNYTLEESIQPSYMMTTPITGNFNVSVTSVNQIIQNLDFGNLKLIGTIKGKAFLDANNNLIYDPAEIGIPNIQIGLNVNCCGPVGWVFTDSNGDYEFDNVILGNYMVSQYSNPTNYILKSPVSGIKYTAITFPSQIVNNVNFIYSPANDCANPAIIAPTEGCTNSLINMQLNNCTSASANITWSFGDGTYASGTNVSHTYLYANTYNLSVAIAVSGQSPITLNYPITIKTCIVASCVDCIGSLQPEPGNYIVSLWAKEDVSPQPKTYSNPKVEISFTGSTTLPITIGTNSAKNKIIDGWQRIDEEITIPTDATYINLKLKNAGPNDVYFDDIRFHPKDGQMKTYVYDPITLRLSATLDENNYATFYEYDEEGKLIRVKKETEKGIMTIQESREGVKKK